VETARAATRPYQQADRIRFFSGTAEVAPGITGMPALGHTAGHSIFRFTDGPSSLLTLGDLVHLPALQLAQPDVQTRLDMQPDLAASSRRRFLQEAASNREFVIGSHIASHTVARVRAQGEGFVLQAT
jgi:glyoxylase-like metal-dependent hydrolase (beta-lactamase superfamily II)